MKRVNISTVVHVAIAALTIVLVINKQISHDIAFGVLCGIILTLAGDLIFRPRGFQVVSVNQVSVPITRDENRIYFPSAVIERRNNVWFILHPKTLKEISDPLQSEADAITVMLNAEKRVLREEFKA